MPQKIIYGVGICFLLVLFQSGIADSKTPVFPDSSITLHLKNAPAGNAVRSIMAQIGLKYAVIPSDLFTELKTRTVTMNLNHAPFWTAMRQLVVQTGVSIWNPYNSSVFGLQLTNQNNLIGPKTPVSIDDEFLTELYGIGLSRNVNFTDGTPTIQQQFTLTMIFAINPNLMILQVLPNQPHVTQAIDNHGHALVYPGQVFGDQNSLISTPATRWWASCWFPLRRPHGIGNRIKVLQGTITAIVATKLKTFRYSLATDKPKTFKITGLKIRVQGVKKKHGYYWLDYSVVTPANISSKKNGLLVQTEIEEAENPWNFSLEDAHGRKFQRESWSQDFQGFRVPYNTNFPFDYPASKKAVGPPVTLVFTLPENARRVVVPFKFKNVLLP